MYIFLRVFILQQFLQISLYFNFEVRFGGKFCVKLEIFFEGFFIGVELAIGLGVGVFIMLGRICVWDVGVLNGGIILGGFVVKYISKLNVNLEYLNKYLIVNN